jgi:hypothetical protein
MAILGTQITSILGGGGDIKPMPHGPETKHHPASLSGELHGVSKATELSISGKNPEKYTDNLPK